MQEKCLEKIEIEKLGKEQFQKYREQIEEIHEENKYPHNGFLLDEDYISRNNITTANIYQFVGNYNSNIKTSLEEAYRVSSYKNIYKYYTKVVLNEETLYDSTLQGYNYYIVTINENELTYAIEPISEIIYNNKVKGS